MIAVRLYSDLQSSGSEWLGEIPSHWQAKKLKHIACFSNSNVDKHSKEGQRSVRLCNYIDVYYNDKIHSGLPFMRSTASLSEIARFSLIPGDVIITKDSEDLDDIGIPALVAEQVPGLICGYHLTVIRPAKEIDAEYLFRAIQADNSAKQFSSRASGVTRYGLGQDAIGSLLLAIPPIAEQRAVAAFLDYETARTDRLIEKQQRLIELLQEKRQAVISHAVTKGLNPNVPMKDSGVEWLGYIPGNWATPRLKHIVTSHGGSTPSKERESYWEGHVPWVSPKDMKQRIITNSQDHLSEAAVRETGLTKIPSGAVLIVVRGMILAHSVPVALTTNTVTINQDMKALVPDQRTRPEYLLLLLEGVRDVIFKCIDSSAHGTRKLDWEDFGRLRVPLPPRKTQDEILTEVDSTIRQIDCLVERGVEFIARLREHRTALISAAVTGKIDVRYWRPPESLSEAEERDGQLLQAAEERATYG